MRSDYSSLLPEERPPVPIPRNPPLPRHSPASRGPQLSRSTERSRVWPGGGGVRRPSPSHSQELFLDRVPVFNAAEKMHLFRLNIFLKCKNLLPDVATISADCANVRTRQ